MEDQIATGIAIQEVSFDKALIDESFIRVDEHVFLAGDLSDEKLEQHITEEHIQTVLNLRNKDEDGYRDHAELLKKKNVKYLNVPTLPSVKPSAEILKLIAVEVKKAAKPILIKCRRGFRSAFVAEHIFSHFASIQDRRIEQITQELFVAGQVNKQDVELAKEKGIKAVVNLRMPAELSEAEIAEERKWCQDAGLEFHHFPVGGPGFLQDTEKMDGVIVALAKVPRPALIHCKSGMRAKIATMMSLHTGVAKEVAPPIPDTIVDMVSNYVNKRAHAVRLNEHLLPVSDEIFVTGQLDAGQMKELPKLVKSVLNLRDPQEEGFLVEEKEIVEGLGLKYANVPTKVEKIPTAEDFTKIQAALAELPKPVLIHCRKGFRSSHFVNKHE